MLFQKGKYYSWQLGWMAKISHNKRRKTRLSLFETYRRGIEITMDVWVWKLPKLLLVDRKLMIDMAPCVFLPIKKVDDFDMGSYKWTHLYIPKRLVQTMCWFPKLRYHFLVASFHDAATTKRWCRNFRTLDLFHDPSTSEERAIAFFLVWSSTPSIVSYFSVHGS